MPAHGNHRSSLPEDDDVRSILLPSPLLYEGKQLITAEDASVFILSLPQEKRNTHHWRVAHAAFSCASMEPAYLNTAFVSLKLALTLDALIDPDLLSFSG
jgi:hypothetical protein